MTATTPIQPALRLPPLPPAEVTLIPLDHAAACAGIHLDHALERAEGGEWPWAFDLRAGQERRTIHVFRGCLAPSPDTRHPSLPEVIERVLGTAMPEVRLVSLEVRWSVRAQTIRRWLAAGEITGRRAGHTLWLSRASLAAFLERRRV